MTMPKLLVRQQWLRRNDKRFAKSAPTAGPRLLVDVSVIIGHDAQTGIQRVVRAVWSELLWRNGSGFELVPVYATASHGYCYAPLDFLDRRAMPLPTEPVAAGPSDHFLGLDLSTHALQRYRRQLKAWRAAGAKIHIFVYDLLPLHRPDWFTGAAVARFRGWLDVVAKQADQAICISRQVARDLRELVQFQCERSPLLISHVAMGGDIASSRPSRGICDSVGALLDRMRFRPAILMVGTVEPRKGYPEAIAAFEYLWDLHDADAPDLVIVGKPGWKTEKLQQRLRAHSQRGRRLHWLEGISDEALCKLYDSCRGILIASRGEGFGLPLLEAAIHGRHSLVRDLAVFREQQLPNVAFFGDDRPEVLGAAIMRLTLTGRDKAESSAGLPTWKTCVDDLLDRLGLVPSGSQFAPPPARVVQI